MCASHDQINSGNNTEMSEPQSASDHPTKPDSTELLNPVITAPTVRFADKRLHYKTDCPHLKTVVQEASESDKNQFQDCCWCLNNLESDEKLTPYQLATSIGKKAKGD
jgi:exoribonuclease II